jgi:hypothetical protein
LYGVRGIFLSLTGFQTMRFASPQLVADALMTATTGMLGVYIGYVCPIGLHLASSLPIPSVLRAGEVRYMTAAIAVGAAVGLAGELMMIAVSPDFIPGDVLSAAGTFWIVPLMAFLPFALYLSVLNRESGTSGPAAGAFQLAAGVLIAAAFLARPSKQWLLQPAYYVAILYHYRRRRMTPTAALLTGLIGFSAAQLLYIYVHWNSDIESFRSLLANSSANAPNLWSLIFSRFYGLESMAAIIAHVYQTGSHLLGQTYADIPLFFVPRALWPDKSIAWSYHFSFLLAEYTGHGAGEFAATTYIGELFLNFGIIGVMIGTVAFGLVMRAIYEYLIGRVRTKSAQLIYAVLLVHFIQTCEGSLSGAIPLAICDLIPLVILLMLSLALEAVPQTGRRRLITAQPLGSIAGPY